MPDPVENLTPTPAPDAAPTPAPAPTPPAADAPPPVKTDAQVQAEDMAVIDAAIADANAGVGLPPAEVAPVSADDPPASDTPPADVPSPQPAADDAPPAEQTPEEVEDAKVASALGIKNEKANLEFRGMRAKVRELEPMVEPAQKWVQMETFLREAEIQPADFGGAMNILAAFKPTAPIEQKRVAFKALMDNARILGAQIGEEAEAFDPLSLPENKDLAEAVNDERMERGAALQVSRARALEKHNSTVTQTRTQATQTEQALADARNDAVKELNTLGVTLAAADPQFQAKSDAMKPMMQKLFARLHPSQWAAAFQDAYAEYRLPTIAPPAPPTPSRPAPLQHQPLRPTGAKVSVLSPEIKTDMDAIEAGLRAANEANGVAYSG